MQKPDSTCRQHESNPRRRASQPGLHCSSVRVLAHWATRAGHGLESFVTEILFPYLSCIPIKQHKIFIDCNFSVKLPEIMLQHTIGVADCKDIYCSLSMRIISVSLQSTTDSQYIIIVSFSSFVINDKNLIVSSFAMENLLQTVKHSSRASIP